ncbi:MAG: cyclic lactone autoinducer peptide [Eubacterium sp.]|nr:cyclic lactone autoinducer peptide [Eubacterium sp.]
MNSSKKILKGTTKLAQKAAERSAFLDTYGTTCIYFYQPKVPAALRNNKKLNDK